MMYEEFERMYWKNLEKVELPEALKNTIRLEGCLKQREHMCTFLVSHINTGRKYVLKIADKKRGRVLECERDILKELYQKGIHIFPKPEFLIEEKEMFYYGREYIEGENLLSIVKKRGCMPERVLAETGIKLCGLLEILHQQVPPVIYRDIKPENIIYKGNHTFTFIDFETVRKYSRKKDQDTLIMGSRPTAAPEQFGYSQTDPRTDIYGLGMTMLFLASGNYDRENLKNLQMSVRMRRIIRKATAFNPDKRYSTVGYFRKDLLKYLRYRLSRN